MKIYLGFRNDGNIKVTVTESYLPGNQGKVFGSINSGINVPTTKNLEHRVFHSPDGFNWGYGGSGPADLARSILWDYLGRKPEAFLYQEFKRDFVSKWGNEWFITNKEIKQWIESKEVKIK